MCKETGACGQYQQAVGCEQNFDKFSFYLQALDWQAVLLTKIYIKRHKIEPIRAFKTFTNWLTCFQLIMELFWLFSLCPPLCSFDTDTPLFLFLTLDIRVKVNLMKFCFSFARLTPNHPYLFSYRKYWRETKSLLTLKEPVWAQNKKKWYKWKSLLNAPKCTNLYDIKATFCMHILDK